MKTILTIFTFLILLLPISSYSQLYSDGCNESLCMTLEPLGCDNGKQCFKVTVTSSFPQKKLCIYVDGIAVKCCDFAKECTDIVCIEAPITALEDLSAEEGSHIGCSGDLLIDGCIVTIDPCK